MSRWAAEISPVHELAAILGAILDGYVLPVNGFHGVVHWARVLENRLRMPEANGADREVVTLFALFHDSSDQTKGTKQRGHPPIRQFWRRRLEERRRVRRR